MTGWADQLVLTQKPTPAMLEAIEASSLPLLDVAGVIAGRVKRAAPGTDPCVAATSDNRARYRFCHLTAALSTSSRYG